MKILTYLLGDIVYAIVQKKETKSMEINKQLFKDVLSGKLKGKFVLRNGYTYFSADLYRNYNKFRFTHPYMIGFGSYTPEGIFSTDNTTSKLDIVNFITDVDMKQNELKITIPDGQEIDWQESAKQEKIVFKKKDIKPRSWEEYCNNFKGQFYYIQDDRNNIGTSFTTKGFISVYKNILPSKELAEKFLAYIQLMNLYKAWVKDCKYLGHCIRCHIDGTLLITNGFETTPLRFPTREMAVEFRDCFKDLLEQAKGLY